MVTGGGGNVRMFARQGRNAAMVSEVLVGDEETTAVVQGNFGLEEEEGAKRRSEK